MTVTWVVGRRDGGRRGRREGVVLVVLLAVFALLVGTAASASAATAPSVPQSVTAAVSTTTSTSAVLSWKAPSSTGGSSITGYVVSRDGTDSTGYGAWSGTTSASATSASFNQLVPGATYRLSVRAVNAVGASAVVTVTFTAPASVPSAPQSVTAAVSSTASTSAVLSWRAPSSTGGSAITGYVVSRDGKDSTGYGAWSGTTSASATSASFNELVPGATYTLSVRAKNSAGLGPVSSVTYVVSPSGVPMPVGNLSGWKQVFTEDFTTPVALGSWPGSYSSKFKDYQADTCKLPEGWGCDTNRNGVWNAKKTVSVGEGAADYWLHSENGTAYSAGILPQAPQQTYGRYDVRFKVDSGMKGWHSAWLLWPDSDKWADGEIDWPEGDLSGSMNAYTHFVGDPKSQTAFESTIPFASGWHTATTEWLPGAVKYYLDAKLLATHTTKVASTPMHWVLQSETGPTKPTTSGHIKIDWVVQYARS